MKKKIFIFLPDGVGLRNFAFTQFKKIGEQKGYDIVYWNNTVFSLKEQFNFEEVKIENHKLHQKLNLQIQKSHQLVKRTQENLQNLNNNN